MDRKSPRGATEGSLALGLSSLNSSVFVECGVVWCCLQIS